MMLGKEGVGLAPRYLPNYSMALDTIIRLCFAALAILSGPSFPPRRSYPQQPFARLGASWIGGQGMVP